MDKYIIILFIFVKDKWENLDHFIKDQILKEYHFWRGLIDFDYDLLPKELIDIIKKEI